MAAEGLKERLAARYPLAVVLDDLHWADDMTLRFLAFFGRRLPEGARLLVVNVIDQGALITAILMVQFAGIPFAFLFGMIAGRIGAREAHAADLNPL